MPETTGRGTGDQRRLISSIYRTQSEEAGDRESIAADLDRQLDAVWAWLWKAMGVLGALAALVLMLAGMLVLAWRWTVRGLCLVRDKIFGRFGQMYRWLDEFSPSETDEEREEKFVSLREHVLALWRSSALPWIEMFTRQTLLDWGILILMVVVAAVGFWLLVRLVWRYSKRVVMRVRGVQLEALRPGSLFASATQPASQVEVLVPGLLMDSHQAYGVRIRDYLVLPKHVVSGFTEVVLAGPTGKILLPVSTIDSRLCEDLAYWYIGQDVFSRIGVVSGRLPKGTGYNLASCYGPSGASSGRVSKAAIRGKLIYQGSTIPGMSGAGYYVNGAVFGIHQGACGGSNIGFSIDVVKLEIRKLMNFEAFHGPSPGKKDEREEEEEYRSKFETNWKYDEIERMVTERYSNDSWADDVDEDEDFWNKKLVFEAGASPKVPEKITIHKANGEKVKIPLRISHQNETGKMVTVDLVPAHLLDYLSALKEEQVLENVRLLMQPAVPKPPAVRVPCQFCAQVCKSEKAMANHLLNSHPVKGESAVPEDTGASGSLVKQSKTSFLGKGASNQKKRPLSEKPSKKLGQKSPLTSLEASLSLMASSQRNIETLLNKVLEVSAGRSLATMQS